MFVRSPLIPRHGHSQCGRESSAGVPRAVRIMLTLTAQHEPVQTARSADGVELFAASGEKFVNVGLVAHVENEMVLRCVEDVVHSKGEFNDTQIGTKMATVFGENGDEFFADFLGELLKLREGKFFHIYGGINSVKYASHDFRANPQLPS